MEVIDVVLVNENDEPIGTMEKLEAHEKGRLHRAFSILVYNKKGEMLLQRRADEKYHSPGKWSNACCGHPKPNQEIASAAKLRLMEEMGLDLNINPELVFTYQAGVGDNLIEHEIDHVFTAVTDKEPVVNPQEASGYKWVTNSELKQDVAINPWRYTPWFIILLDKLATK